MVPSDGRCRSEIAALGYEPWFAFSCTWLQTALTRAKSTVLWCMCVPMCKDRDILRYIFLHVMCVHGTG